MIKWYFKLNYFHGSMLVLQHLRSLLCRKYLSLSERDHSLHSDFAARYSLAILNTRVPPPSPTPRRLEGTRTHALAPPHAVGAKSCARNAGRASSTTGCQACTLSCSR